MGIIISIDSGSKEFGWSAVRRVGPRAKYVASGNAPATRIGWESVVDMMATRRGDDDIVAVYIETPEGYVHEAFRGPTLLETARMVGGIQWECQGRGQVVELRTAGWWRKALVGKASSPKKGEMDRLIKSAVSSHIAAMPPTSNVHVRDALGLGIVACWEMASRRAA